MLRHGLAFKLEECLRKGLGTWAHWGSWKQSEVSEIEDVAETSRKLRGGKGSAFTRCCSLGIRSF